MGVEVNKCKEKLALEDEGRLLRLQQGIAENIFGFLHAGFGYLQRSITCIEASTGKWVWSNGAGCTVAFTNPFLENREDVRETPIELGRVAEEAAIYPCDNRTGQDIHRSFEREVVVSTQAKITKSDTYSWGLEAGFEGGQSGQEANMGYTWMFSVKATLGGEHARQWEDEKGSSVTRKLSNEFDSKAMTRTRVLFTIDKIDMQQTLLSSGFLNYRVSLDTRAKEHNGELDAHHVFSGSVLEAASIEDLCARMLGLKGSHISNVPKHADILDYHDAVLADFINALLNKESRKIQNSITVQYKDAGEFTNIVYDEGYYTREENGSLVYTPYPKQAASEFMG